MRQKKEKLLFVDTSCNGHHLPYLRSLLTLNDFDKVVLIPEKKNDIHYTQYQIKVDYKKLKGYMAWIKMIGDIAKKENVTIIHFLYGDIFYRFFGVGLGSLLHYKIVITFHHVRSGKLRDFSIKKIFQKIDMGIVHTKSLEHKLKMCGISNIKRIDYPVFENLKKISKSNACKRIGLNDSSPVLLALGGTRFDKGIDILLNALKTVKKPFQLLIAGREEHFKRSDIEKEILEYYDRVTLKLQYLTDEDMELCLNAADFIVLPYRKIFDGASGPLGQGVMLKKTIIGPSHGSLGNIICEKHLGYTFESENVEDLAEIINRAIDKVYIYDEVAMSYRESIMPELFSEKYAKLYMSL